MESDFEVDRIDCKLEFEDSIAVARGRERRRGGARNRGRGRSLSLSRPRRACDVCRRAATVGEQLDLRPQNKEKPDIPNFTGSAGLKQSASGRLVWIIFPFFCLMTSLTPLLMKQN